MNFQLAQTQDLTTINYVALIPVNDGGAFASLRSMTANVLTLGAPLRNSDGESRELHSLRLHRILSCIDRKWLTARLEIA